MSRYDNRIKALLQMLTTAGYTPKHRVSKDWEFEDDEVEVGDNVTVQVDSRAGDAVAVNRWYGTGKDAVMKTWMIEDDGKLLATIKIAKEYIIGT